MKSALIPGFAVFPLLFLMMTAPTEAQIAPNPDPEVEGWYVFEGTALRLPEDPSIRAVKLLDQSGVPTGETVAASNSGFTVDTGRDKTMVYLLEFNGTLD